MSPLILTLTLAVLFLAACAAPETSTPSFADDVAFLQRHGDVQLLQAPNGGRVALSAQYQGRVMTSAVAEDAPSLGWINRDFITAGQTGTPFDNYGGEDRFWLGPEAGQFGLYFPPGTPFSFDNWQVPAILHQGAWTIRDQTDESVTFARTMEIANYSGAIFHLEIRRTVRLQTGADVQEALGVQLPVGLDWVGYETVNTVTNTGVAPWEKATGLPSIWILGMYNPFDKAWVVIPYDESGSGPVVNDGYFGAIPDDRLQVSHQAIIFKCDGDYRSKIGLGPSRAKNILGSYVPSMGLLTLIQFNQPQGAAAYVNSMWELQENPFSGDVLNSYNDGPPEPGKPAMGGFYELETSSPALALAPGESYTHIHRTIHLTGSPTALDPIAQATLGIPTIQMTIAD